MYIKNNNKYIRSQRIYGLISRIENVEKTNDKYTMNLCVNVYEMFICARTQNTQKKIKF